VIAVWKWIRCFLAGGHDDGVSCGQGAIFLKCARCGRRSHGWVIDEQREARRERSERAARAQTDARDPASEHAR
jgi:hypothetical protein